MNHLHNTRRLVNLSLIVMLASILSFVSLSAHAASAKDKALIIFPQYNNIGTPSLVTGYSFATMNGTGVVASLTKAKSNTSSSPIVGAGKAAFIAYNPPAHLEVVDLKTGASRNYTVPPGIPTSRSDGGLLNIPLEGLFTNDGKHLLMVLYMQDIRLLDLVSGTYSIIPGTKSYYPIGQSLTDNLIYADSLTYSERLGGAASYDLAGNLHLNAELYILGKYQRASGLTLSPAGKYLYFLALDPDQPAPQHQGPGIEANVIMRYRISDGISSVIVRAQPGNIIDQFTLTSNDPYITYSELVPTTDSSGNYNGSAKQSLIKRENLATFTAPETLINNAPANDLLWCGDTLYYDYPSSSDGSKYLTASYDPSSGVSGFAAAQLLGCAP